MLSAFIHSRLSYPAVLLAEQLVHQRPTRNHATFLIGWPWTAVQVVGLVLLELKELHPKVLPIAMWRRLNCLKCPGNLLRWKQVRLASVAGVFYWDGGCRHANGERKLCAELTAMNSLKSMRSLFYNQPPVWGLDRSSFKDWCLC